MTPAVREFDTSVPSPTRRGGLEGVNGRILSAILRHRHFLLQAENSVVRDFVEAIREARDNVTGELAKMAAREGAESDLSELRRSRLEQLQRQFEAILSSAETDSLRTFQRRLEQLGAREQEIQANLLRRAIPDGIHLDLVGPDIDRVRAIVEQPLGGVRFAERFRRNFGEMVPRMKRSLTTSMALGEGIGPAQRRLRSVVDGLGINRATLIARSEVQRVANQTAEDLYKRNQDVLKGEMWVATLDSRTCVICGSRDGETWPIGEGPTPPNDSHAACRCFKSPVTRSWEELGLNREELPPSTRASMDGQVPSNITYSDWFADQDDTFQRQVLGPARFERFQAGDLTLNQMWKNQQVLPIDALPVAT